MTVILYVEDNADVSDAVVELLASPDRRFQTCRTLQAARTYLAAHEADLVITDLNLPDGSGMDLVRDLAAGGVPVSVIVCTGHDVSALSVPHHVQLRVVRKPFELEDLESAIDHALARN